MAIGDVVKSTLGPKGMNKILQSASTGEISVTNDGATILKSIQLDNAAAKILVNISKVQDDEVGDGTTSVCVLASELLREAEKLVASKIHPQTIVEGYRIASQVALESLEKSAVDNGYAILSYPHLFLTRSCSADMEKFKQDLVNIARTTISSKVLAQDKQYFAELAVDAVLRLQGSTDLDHIQIIKKVGGKLRDSYLDSGFILDKSISTNCPKQLENAKILIANTCASFPFSSSHHPDSVSYIAMDTDKIKVFGARVRVDGTGKLAELERAEKEKMKAKVAQIAAHGVNVFVNRQLVYNYPEQLLAEAGIMVIEHADFEGVERLSLVTGGEIVSTFDAPDKVKLGRCNLIEEVMIGEDKVCSFAFEAIFQRLLVTNDYAPPHVVDQILRRCLTTSLHRDPARVNNPNGRRSRTVSARRSLCPLPNRARNACGARRRLQRDAHVMRSGRTRTHGNGQKGGRG